MKKQFFSMSGVVFLCIFGACLLNLAVMSIVLKIANILVVISPFAEVVIRLAVSLIMVAGIPSAVAYLVSYKMAKFDTKNACGTFCVASLFQLLLALLLKFHPFISGGVLYLAGIFESGSSFANGADIEYIGIIDYLLAYVICFAFGLACYLVFGKLGMKKRIADREELMGQSGLN